MNTRSALRLRLLSMLVSATLAACGGADDKAAPSSSAPAPAPAPEVQSFVWTKVFDGAGNGVSLTQGVMVDPVRPGDFYVLGNDASDTSELILLKSTDYGRTWVRKRTRRLADYNPAASASANSALTSNVIHGVSWGAVIDPNKNRDPNTPPTLYTPAGFNDLGLYKSADGGETWQQMMAFDTSFAPYKPDGYPPHDFYQVTVVPDSGPNHLLVTYHYGWKGAGGVHSNDAGLGESLDGGRTWVWHSPPVGMGNSNYVVALDATTWITVSNGNGFTGAWRTTTAGRVNGAISTAAWQKVYNFEHIHGSFQPAYVDGVLHMPGLWNPMPGTLDQQMGGILSSADQGRTWRPTFTTNAFDYMVNVVATPSRLYAMDMGYGNSLVGRCVWSARGATLNWTPYTCPPDLLGDVRPYASASTRDAANKQGIVVLASHSDIWRLVETTR